MSSEGDNVLRGSRLGPVPECSLAEYLLPMIRSLPQEQIIQIDADTDAVQTVGELLEMGIRLSEGLKRSGLKENDIVALLCRNCIESCATVLGVWLSSATVAPIDGRLKLAELKHLLGLSRPKYVFCEEEVTGNVVSALSQLSIVATVIIIGEKKSNSPHVFFQDLLVEAEVKNYKARPVKSPDTQLIGILPSSGTSGLPKGVGITHRMLILQCMKMRDIECFHGLRVILQISCFYWITGIFTFVGSLMFGAPRVLMRETTSSNLLKAIEKYKTNWVVIGPLTALDVLNNPDFDLYDTSSMEKLILGGSLLSREIGERLKAKWKNVEFRQSYGTTELSLMVTATDKNEDMYSVGKVTHEIQVKMVDQNTGESLGANALGEIWVKSPVPLYGYVGNENSTKEVLDSEGWFHSGDLGYYDDRGLIYVVDRIKEMVKIADKQVAPTEIEHLILSLEGVTAAGVSGVTHDGTVFELLGLIVKKNNSKITAEDIHAVIAENLSSFKKLTAGIYFVESLPMTSSGKLQRREVKKMAQALYSSAR